MFFAGKHGPTVGVCDKELLGKVFREGKVVLNISKSYFGGRKVNKNELIKILMSSNFIWLVGEKAVNTAIEVGLASKDNTKTVCGIPHLNIYRLSL